MRHIGDLLLGVVDGLDDVGCELLEVFGQPMLFGRCFTAGGVSFGVGGDGSIRVETADGAVAFLQDAATFFEKGLAVFDDLFLVQLLLWCAVGFFETLRSC